MQVHAAAWPGGAQNWTADYGCCSLNLKLETLCLLQACGLCAPAQVASGV